MTTQMKDLSFMNKLCDPDHRPVSAIINAPFSLRDGEGEIISAVTGGHALIGIYQDSDYPELKDAERLKVIRIMTPTQLHNQHKIDFGKLKTWAGRPEWSVKCDACTDGYSATCNGCDGSGLNNKNDDVCPSCDGEGKYECKACRGIGMIGGNSRLAVLFGIAVDANLLAKYIEHVDGNIIDLYTAGKHDHLILQGQNWTISIMPMRVDYSLSMTEFNEEVKL